MPRLCSPRAIIHGSPVSRRSRRLSSCRARASSTRRGVAARRRGSSARSRPTLSPASVRRARPSSLRARERRSRRRTRPRPRGWTGADGRGVAELARGSRGSPQVLRAGLSNVAALGGDGAGEVQDAPARLVSRRPRSTPAALQRARSPRRSGRACGRSRRATSRPSPARRRRSPAASASASRYALSAPGQSPASSSTSPSRSRDAPALGALEQRRDALEVVDRRLVRVVRLGRLAGAHEVVALLRLVVARARSGARAGRGCGRWHRGSVASMYVADALVQVARAARTACSRRRPPA